MTDPILTAARALAYDLGLTEEGPHGPELRESAVRKIQAFALRQRADGARLAEHVGFRAFEDGGDIALEMIALASRLEAQAKEIEG